MVLWRFSHLVWLNIYLCIYCQGLTALTLILPLLSLPCDHIVVPSPYSLSSYRFILLVPMWNPKPYYLLLHSSIDKSLISITLKGCFFVLDSTWLTDMSPFHFTLVLRNYPPSPYPIPISLIGVLNPSFPFGTHLAIGDKDTKVSFLIFNKLNIHIATPWLTTTHHTTETVFSPQELHAPGEH